MKSIIFIVLGFFHFLSAQDISGYWKVVDENTQLPRCAVAVYQYGNLHYGRIIATFNSEGKLSESIYHPVDRAPGIVGKPFYCGLDLLWDLEDNGVSYRGKIVDPEKGKIYNAEVWVQNGDLIVRGKLLMFGRNQTWKPILKTDFPKDFKMPELSSFVPRVPEVN